MMPRAGRPRAVPAGSGCTCGTLVESSSGAEANGATFEGSCEPLRRIDAGDQVELSADGQARIALYRRPATRRTGRRSVVGDGEYDSADLAVRNRRRREIGGVVTAVELNERRAVLNAFFRTRANRARQQSDRERKRTPNGKTSGSVAVRRHSAIMPHPASECLRCARLRTEATSHESRCRPCRSSRSAPRWFDAADHANVEKRSVSPLDNPSSVTGTPTRVRPYCGAPLSRSYQSGSSARKLSDRGPSGRRFPTTHSRRWSIRGFVSIDDSLLR